MRAQTARSEAQVRVRQVSEAIAALERHKTTGKPLRTFPGIASDPQIRQAELEIFRLEVELAGATKLQGEEHPSVQQARAKLKTANALVDQMAQEQADALKAQADMAQATEREQAGSVDNCEKRLSEWRKAKVQYDMLAMEAETAKAIYRNALTAVLEAGLFARGANNIVLIDDAPVPLKPVKPRIALTLAMGIGAGLCLFLVGWLLKS